MGRTGSDSLTNRETRGPLGSLQPVLPPSLPTSAAREIETRVPPGSVRWRRPPSRGAYAMTCSQLRQSGTIIATHLHHRMQRHPRRSRDLVPRRRRSPPEGRRIVGCTGVDAEYRSGGADQGYVASAAMAGSMPAWASPRSTAPTRALGCALVRAEGRPGLAKEPASFQRASEPPPRRRQGVGRRSPPNPTPAVLEGVAIVVKVFRGCDAGSQGGLSVGLGQCRGRLAGSDQTSEQGVGGHPSGKRTWMRIQMDSVIPWGRSRPARTRHLNHLPT